MKSTMTTAIAITAGFLFSASVGAGEWIEMFDGKSLKGWKVNTENPKSITVKDGNIVIDGPRAHLFYAGDVADANFKNFVFRAQVKTFPKANSGIYFHTKYQAKG